jgi:hypothetical protein
MLNAGSGVDIDSHADVVRTSNRAELVLCTLAAVIGLFTFMVGWAGILNHSFLAINTLGHVWPPPSRHPRIDNLQKTYIQSSKEKSTLSGPDI